MRPEIIAIGGSLGAVGAVRELCRALPQELAAAVAIVLHVGAEGNNLLADVLDSQSAIRVKTAASGDPVRRGTVYIAPTARSDTPTPRARRAHRRKAASTKRCASRCACWKNARC